MSDNATAAAADLSLPDLHRPDLYRQLVLDHSRAPRHFGVLAAATHAADGSNPLCGDALHIDLCVSGDRIETFAFHGDACAIAKATASMLGDRVVQLGVDDVAALEADFMHVIGGEVARVEALGDLNALAPLVRYPARRKCALLAFATLRAALAGAATISTEGKSQ